MAPALALAAAVRKAVFLLEEIEPFGLSLRAELGLVSGSGGKQNPTQSQKRGPRKGPYPFFELHGRPLAARRWCIAMTVFPYLGSQSGRSYPDSCGPGGVPPAPKGLPRANGRDKLDPDVLAFVEALARYAARRDHEAQTRKLN